MKSFGAQDIPVRAVSDLRAREQQRRATSELVNSFGAQDRPVRAGSDLRAGEHAAPRIVPSGR